MRRARGVRGSGGSGGSGGPGGGGGSGGSYPGIFINLNCKCCFLSNYVAYFVRCLIAPI